MLPKSLLVALVLMLCGSVARADIIDEWASVQSPAKPVLKSVTVPAKTTALMMLDFLNRNCGTRPRCVATLPAVKKLLASARAAHATVVYSIISNSTTSDVMKDVAPKANELHVLSGPDKFVETDLEKILKDRGITTVIVAGTASNGAVLFTAMGAVMRGMNVVVPVDGMSAADPYADLSTVYMFGHAPSLAVKSTLTRGAMIGFE
jgi:nicotinamidase-related amidase